MRFKQEILHPVSLKRVRVSFSLAACLFGIAVLAASADVSDAQSLPSGSGEQLTTVRLVAAAGLTNGAYEAGVDILMAPGSHTYWKIPGEAGVPPVFTFNGSQNVASATVEYPTPTRLTEEGLDTFGYTSQVVFPVIVKPADKSKPVKLHVAVDYAVCNKICLPAHGEADLELRSNGTGVSADLVASALAQVPREATASQAAQLAVTTVAGSDTPRWTLTWKGSAPLDNIFPIAPEGFYFTTKQLDPTTWSLAATQSVSTPKQQQVPVSLVLARIPAAGGSLIVSKTFDVGPPSK